MLQALKLKQVAETLNVSLTTVHTLIANGEIDSFKVGRARRVSDEAVAAYIEAKTTANAAERLVGQAEAQGFDRHVTDPAILGRAATLIQGGDAA